MVPCLWNAQSRAQQNTSVVITASLKDISGCLSDYLGKAGYSLGNITHFAGIGDELPVFSHQNNRITGVYWITSSCMEIGKRLWVYTVRMKSHFPVYYK